MSVVDKIIEMIQNLSHTEIEELKVRLFSNSISFGTTIENFTKENRFASGQVCPICGCLHIVRNGHRKDGKQKYTCKECGRHFVVNSNSITAHTRKNYDTWNTYIDCMMNGASIRKSAEICNIHKNTAFHWRHKILDTLQGMQDNVSLNGIVEADETYLPISYKGNHSKDNFVMPRKARKRGKQIHKSGLSDEYVCIPCAVNRKGKSIGRVSKLGKVSSACIDKTLGTKIEKSSVLCTDKEQAYRRFSKERELNLKQMEIGQSIKGIYNIQHINAYHSDLKTFLRPFKGVSTKYLNNYLVWNNLVIHATETVTEKKKIFREYVLTEPITIHCRDISNRPALPLVA